MSYYEGYAPEPRALGLSGEVAARIVDFLTRKTRSVPERIEALCGLIEEKVLREGVRDGLLGLVRKFRWEIGVSRGVDAALTETDWQLLVHRIERYERTTTIENYSAYIFSMDGLSGPLR